MSEKTDAQRLLDEPIADCAFDGCVKMLRQLDDDQMEMCMNKIHEWLEERQFEGERDE